MKNLKLKTLLANMGLIVLMNQDLSARTEQEADELGILKQRVPLLLKHEDEPQIFEELPRVAEQKNCPPNHHCTDGACR